MVLSYPIYPVGATSTGAGEAVHGICIRKYIEDGAVGVNTVPLSRVCWGCTLYGSSSEIGNYTDGGRVSTVLAASWVVRFIACIQSLLLGCVVFRECFYIPIAGICWVFLCLLARIAERLSDERAVGQRGLLIDCVRLLGGGGML